MKKNRSLGVFEEIKRISVSFVILAFIGMMALLFTMDAGRNYTNIQDYGHMDFYTDYFTINGFDTGSIIISASGIDAPPSGVRSKTERALHVPGKSGWIHWQQNPLGLVDYPNILCQKHFRRKQ